MSLQPPFHSLPISPEVLSALGEIGLSEMTAIQSAVIPRMLQGKDVIAQSKTGSGKTAAFAIPLLHRLRLSEQTPQALILCPTRELCEQVLKECLKISKHLKKFRAVSLSGGQPSGPQLEALKCGVQLAVGTPGRTLELLRSGAFDGSKVTCLVLDEADRLLEEGFADELSAIVAILPAQRHTAFFSATFPEAIQLLSKRYQRDAEFISVKTPLETNDALPPITQYLYAAENPAKFATLKIILKNHPAKRILIFCRTKAAVNEVGKILTAEKWECGILHGDLPQKQRDRAMSLFKNGNLQILVATDVAARGLHIETLGLVVNFDMPPTIELYVHRIGRTGRAGESGVAASIATAYETSFVQEIETATGTLMERM